MLFPLSVVAVATDPLQIQDDGGLLYIKTYSEHRMQSKFEAQELMYCIIYCYKYNNFSVVPIVVFFSEHDIMISALTIIRKMKFECKCNTVMVGWFTSVLTCCFVVTKLCWHQITEGLGKMVGPFCFLLPTPWWCIGRSCCFWYCRVIDLPG